MSDRSGDARPTLVSLVVPALNEAPNVPALLERLEEFTTSYIDFDFELVLVDDGSTDGTARRLLDDAKADQQITVVRLSRNFGSHYAISAGFRQCSGDVAVVLGADMQEPIDLLGKLLVAWQAGADVVWGVRQTRTGRPRHAEFLSRLFSFLFTRFADLQNYPAEGPSGVLVDRCVLVEVNALEERNRNVLALIAWLGFTQTRVSYDQLPRANGKSRWTRTKMVKLAVDSFLQFSSMPLRACSATGLLVSGAGLLYALVLVARAAFGVHTPSGWATLLVVVLVLGGVQLTVFGVMGEYLWRAVEEVRRRPLYVVRDVKRSGASTHPQERQRPR